MKPTCRLIQHSARITLFTRANCSLCETAKDVLSKVQKNRIVEYNEVNVMESDQRKWREVYEFDTPVVCDSKFCLYFNRH